MNETVKIFEEKGVNLGLHDVFRHLMVRVYRGVPRIVQAIPARQAIPWASGLSGKGNMRAVAVEANPATVGWFLHNPDGPAFIFDQKLDMLSAFRLFGVETKSHLRIEMWVVDGFFHREEGPAVSVILDGKHHFWEYYKNGFHHREDGPALTKLDLEEWYSEGDLHREGGPASKSNTVDKWYSHGRLHRLDGPAVVRRPHVAGEDREDEWHVMGQRLDSPFLSKLPSWKTLMEEATNLLVVDSIHSQ
jgi:hypothetical protein